MIPERAIVIDTESTGFSPNSGDRLVEFAALELRRGVPTGARLHSLFWPQRAVPPQAAAIHGWTTERLRGKPLFADKAEEIADFLAGAELWAHSAPFDTRFLNAEMERAGLKAGWKISCSLKLAKTRLPHLSSHKLSALTSWAGHTWTGRAHTAMADTEALACVLTRLWDMPDTGRVKAKPAVGAVAPAARASLAPWTGAVVPGHDPRLAAQPWRGLLPRQGKPWSGEEDLLLRSQFLEGATLNELASHMGRSPAALALRLERQGVIAPDHPYAFTRKRT